MRDPLLSPGDAPASLQSQGKVPPGEGSITEGPATRRALPRGWSTGRGFGGTSQPPDLAGCVLGREGRTGASNPNPNNPSPSDKIGCRSGPRPPVPLCPWEMATAVMDYWMLLWNLPPPCRDTPNVSGHHFFQEKPTPSPQCPPRAQVSSSWVHVFPGRRIRAAGCPPNWQPKGVHGEPGAGIGLPHTVSPIPCQSPL